MKLDIDYAKRIGYIKRNIETIQKKPGYGVNDNYFRMRGEYHQLGLNYMYKGFRLNDESDIEEAKYFMNKALEIPESKLDGINEDSDSDIFESLNRVNKLKRRVEKFKNNGN